MYKLRELRREDIPTINCWRNKPELIEYLGAPFRYINPDVDYKWFDNYMSSRSNSVRCAIVDHKFEDKILGLVSLVSINYVHGSAEFHIMIGNPENCGKGIGTFAAVEMLKHAFFNLNLRRVELGVLSTNIRAFNLYKKVGFKEEGIKRQAVYKNGKFIDICMMGILKEEFNTNVCSHTKSEK